jgi:hypothetical protein
MTPIPAGKACVNSVGVMVLVSMGRRVSHPKIAVRGRRSGYRLRSRLSLFVVAACAAGSTSDHVYDGTAWPDFRNASSPVGIPPQSSTGCSDMLGSMNIGMFAREENVVKVLGTILGGLSAP